MRCINLINQERKINPKSPSSLKPPEQQGLPCPLSCPSRRSNRARPCPLACLYPNDPITMTDSTVGCGVCMTPSMWPCSVFLFLRPASARVASWRKKVHMLKGFSLMNQQKTVFPRMNPFFALMIVYAWSYNRSMFLFSFFQFFAYWLNSYCWLVHMHAWGQ